VSSGLLVAPVLGASEFYRGRSERNEPRMHLNRKQYPMRKKKQQRSVIPKERKSRGSKRKERKRLVADGGAARWNILESNGDFWESSALVVEESLAEGDRRG
jgi:hypothetical protein